MTPESDRLPALTVVCIGLVIAAAFALQLGRGESPALALVGLVGIAGVAAVVQAPILGLVAIVLVTISNLSDIFIVYFGLPSMAKLLAPGLAFILAVRFVIRGEKPFFDVKASVLALAFLLLVGASSLYAPSYATAMEEFDETARNMALVLLMLGFFSYPASIRAFTSSILFAGFAVGTICVYKYTLGDMASDYYGFAQTDWRSTAARLTGTENDANGFGAVLVVMLPLAIDRALWGESRLTKLYGVAAAAVIFASILLTQSRGALLATFAGGLTYLMILDRRTAMKLAAAAAVAGIIAAALLSDHIVERFSSIFLLAEGAQAPDQAVEGRLGSWMVAIQLFFDNPVIGVGAGNFNVRYQDVANELGLIFRGRDRSPHSLYLEVLSELGLVGFALYAIVIFFALRGVAKAMAMLRAQGKPRLRAECGAIGVSLVSHLGAMAFLHGPGARLIWTLFVVAIALPKIVESGVVDPTADRRS